MSRHAAATSLLIAGASVRAAVHSASRSGIRVPIAVDYFGDADLRDRVDHWVSLLSDETPDWLSRVYDLSAETGTRYWMYTGAWENRVAWIDAMPLTLLGNGRTVLDQTRDPWRLSQVLRQAGLPAARLADPRSGPVGDDSVWLLKPIASGGGARIGVWQPGQTRAGDSDCYLQERIAGRSVAGTFVGCRGQAVLLGVAEQLAQREMGGPWPFGYAGSLGPLPLTARQAEQWQQLGTVLSRELSLCGLFGVDAIDTGDKLVVVEVNPRFPASVEVLERGGELRAVALHQAACLAERSRSPNGLPSAGLWQRRRGWAGKLIVFAEQASAANAQLNAWLQRELAATPGSWPRVADLPVGNMPFAAGSPMLTLLAGPAASREEVLADLQRRAAIAKRLACEDNDSWSH